MMDKSLNGINCGNVSVTGMTVEHSLLSKTADELESAHSTFYNVTSSGTHSNLSLEQMVCRAEIESQKLISTISGYMAPIGN